MTRYYTLDYDTLNPTWSSYFDSIDELVSYYSWRSSPRNVSVYLSPPCDDTPLWGILEHYPGVSTTLIIYHQKEDR